MRALVVCCLAAGLACKSGERAPRQEPAELTEVEIARGRDACADYRTRICDAAKRLPDRADLAQECELAPALGDAITTALDAAMGPGVSRRDVLQAQASVRKITGRCIAGLAKVPAP